MILTIDIGNTYVTIGCMDRTRPVFLERVCTDTKKTDLEYAVDLLGALRLHEVETADIEGSVLASVVPVLTPILTKAVERIFRFSPKVADASQKLLSVDIDDPRELGANLIINSVAVLKNYGAPAIVIDMGTATSIGVLNGDGTYIGGAILPGLQSSLDALTGGTAQLSSQLFSGNVSVYGVNTALSVNSGAVFANAGMIDGILSRMEEELASDGTDIEDLHIVATGKLSKLLAPWLDHRVIIDEYLPLSGMAALYYDNQEAGL